MATSKNHKKPTVPQQVVEAEKIAKQMYSSLMLKTAPKATPQGYIMGACYVLKLLIDQASEQGVDKAVLKQFVFNFTNDI